LFLALNFCDKELCKFITKKEDLDLEIIFTSHKAKSLGIQNNNNFYSLKTNDFHDIEKIFLNEEIPHLEEKISNFNNGFAINLMKLGRFLPIAICIKFDAQENEFNLIKLDEYSIDSYLKLKHNINLLEEISESEIALRNAEHCKIKIFREKLFFGRSHLAIIVGEIDSKIIPIIRIHSGCYTGDLLNSLQCDCHDQLHLSIKHMNDEFQKNGRYGVIIYQAIDEGRGIGLANKIRTYHLQREGFDTFEANRLIGYDDDERDFTIATNIIKKLGIKECDLITDNKNKINCLEKSGIIVRDKIDLKIESNSYNINYINTKRSN
jgi:GTP cyclohydrolase II